MRDPKRIRKICNELATLWEAMPDLRLGQLIWVISAEVGNDGDPFYVEDDKMLQLIEDRLKKIQGGFK